MTRRRNPWGYAIDYDQAIAEDERLIAQLERAIAVGAFATDRHDGTTIFDLVVLEAEVATKLGLTAYDRGAVALEIDWHRLAGELPAGVPDLDWNRETMTRGREVCDRLEAEIGAHLYTEADAKAYRRKAKAALARHKRNREKYA